MSLIIHTGVSHPFTHARDDGNGHGRSARYGNGVVTALQAREDLPDPDSVVVIDSPYLSSASAGLREAVRGLDEVVFARPHFAAWARK